ncbi:ABC transporter ATP-binding protein [Rhodococcus jostii]|uniref:ABC transporter ATP-binding protein n=1 Tax=Rhodococcus jostii TaxID=132919 RepID=UPI003644AE85
MLDVPLGGALGNDELDCDRPVCEALGDKFGYLLFPARETRGSRLDRDVGPAVLVGGVRCGISESRLESVPELRLERAVTDRPADLLLDPDMLEVQVRVDDARIPHRGTFGGNPAADDAAVAAALEHTGLTSKADRLWHRFSGGEKQRVQIARALAQEPRELLLDEPTNHLDIHHQLELLALVTRLPVTSVIALHDLNLAAMFCDTVIVLKEGRVVAGGTPAEVLTSELIAQVYNVRAEVLIDEAKGRLSILFEPGPIPVPVPVPTH